MESTVCNLSQNNSYCDSPHSAHSVKIAMDIAAVSCGFQWRSESREVSVQPLWLCTAANDDVEKEQAIESETEIDTKFSASISAETELWHPGWRHFLLVYIIAFRVLFDKIASVYFIWQIGNNDLPREPALCQLYRHTFAPYKISCQLSDDVKMSVWLSVWSRRYMTSKSCDFTGAGWRSNAAVSPTGSSATTAAASPRTASATDASTASTEVTRPTTPTKPTADVRSAHCHQSVCETDVAGNYIFLFSTLYTVSQKTRH